MRELSRQRFTGEREHIAAVLEHFGQIEFMGENWHFDPTDLFTFKIKRVDNPYIGWQDRETGKWPPLYIIVPNRNVVAIWPRPHEEHSDIKLGSALSDNGKYLCQALAIQLLKKQIGLYFCLTSAGDAITESGALGI